MNVTPRSRDALVLSLFPGLDLLGRGFELEGFSVVRGPDIIYGGDIRRFHVPAGRFDGVIAGSPCPDFSRARRAPPSGLGLELLAEFVRVVREASPAWWWLENVPAVDLSPCCIASEASRAGKRRGFAEFCALQGLSEPPELPGWTLAARYRAVGNGVPLPMARQIAAATRDAVPADSVRLCACGCARVLTGRLELATVACRKRAQRKRDRARDRATWPVTENVTPWHARAAGASPIRAP